MAQKIIILDSSDLRKRPDSTGGKETSEIGLQDFARVTTDEFNKASYIIFIDDTKRKGCTHPFNILKSVSEMDIKTKYALHVLIKESK